MRRRIGMVPGGLLAVAAALLGGCGGSHLRIVPEPDATFAAHVEKADLVLDRTRSGGVGVVSPPGRLAGAGAPDLVFRLDDETRAALWVVGRSRVLVREGPSSHAPRSGEVLSTWEDGALRLALHGRDEIALFSDRFTREDGAGPATLGRGLRSTRGTFRAPLRDAAGAPVGWLRARIDPELTPARLYDAVLPERIDDAIAAAAMLALDAEITRIEANASAP